MREARLIFHLGMPKTGTSVLQNTILQALEAPGAEHLMYPELGRGSRGAAHHDMALQVKSGDRDANRRMAENLIAEITAAASVRPCRTIAICSSEAFTGVCNIADVATLSDFLASFHDRFDTHAFIVVREFSDFLESMYLQSCRARNFRQPFKQYLASRAMWGEKFFLGILQLREWQSDRLSIEFQGGEFNILDHCGTLFELPMGLLRQLSAGVPSNTKLSLKAQIACSCHGRLEAEVGFDIDRRKLYDLLSDGMFFDGDVRQYTLYGPGERKQVHDQYLAIARSTGFSAYATAFRDYRTRDLPVHDLSFNTLKPADLRKISEHARQLRP